MVTRRRGVAALCLASWTATAVVNGHTGDQKQGGDVQQSAKGGGSAGRKRRLEAGCRHLGCFRRDPADSEMNMTLDIAALTLNMCYESCLHEGSSYFATQDGSRCWCSLESHFDYSSGGVGVCDTWCGGDGSTTCGGSDGLSRDYYKIETGEATLGVSAAGDGASNSADPLDRLLELHNAARCMHATGPLEFAEPVAATAKTYADVLASESMCGSAEAAHSTGLGENVFVCAASSSFSGNGAPTSACFSPEIAMEAFYDSQVGGGSTSTYGPYATQVLWKSTTQIGCALRACEKEGLTYDILVCRYSPPAGEDATESEVALEANSKTTCGYE